VTYAVHDSDGRVLASFSCPVDAHRAFRLMHPRGARLVRSDGVVLAERRGPNFLPRGADWVGHGGMCVPLFWGAA